MRNEELIDKTNTAIAELVYEKRSLQKAYNYYNCKRDKEQFKYLEENFGIGQPTSVEFIPLIKKHIDALIGEYLDTPIIPKVSCKDSSTINNIFRDKQLKINTEVIQTLKLRIKNGLLQIINGQNITDLNIKEQLDKKIEEVNQNFISEYEIAALNVIEYIMQSRATDIKTKLREILLDLLITGTPFFRAIPSPNGNNVEIEVLNPLNTFIDRNVDSPYVRDSYRAVIRKYLTRNLILNKYGKELSRKDIDTIKELWLDHLDVSNSYYMRYISTTAGVPASDGIRAGEEITPGFPERPYFRYDNNLIPVYEVEWIETDENFVMQRYSTVRIGDEIYILRGKDENTIRSIDDPTKCTINLNGVHFLNRDGTPYSLMLACMSIQDKYDLTCFYRDKLIANSGSTGDWLNMPTLPAFLGNSMPERITKWLAYKKQGIGLIDTSLEGQLNTGQSPINTMFNGFDDTVKAQAVQAIQLVIDSLEMTASSITGVFRERLNGIQLKDAVTNVLVSVNNSFTITKQWFFLMDLVTVEILTDALNTAKSVYRDGLTGTLILGDKLLKTFTALPEHFVFSDFDIHITTSSNIVRDLELIKQLVPELIRGGLITPDIIMDIATARSLTEAKAKVKVAMQKQEKKNDKMQLLVQQGEQLQQLLQQVTQQLQQAQQKIEQLNEQRMQLQQTEIQLRNQVEMYKAKTDRAYKENAAENNDKRTLIEWMQLYDGNPYNDRVNERTI